MIFETFTQKEIVKVLDRAANRSMVPATGKQTWFLAGLLLKTGQEQAEREIEPFLLGQCALDKRMASDLIGMFKN